MLAFIFIYLEFSLINIALSLCITAHMAELIYEKYLQNLLVNTNIELIPFKYLSNYKILY